MSMVGSTIDFEQDLLNQDSISQRVRFRFENVQFLRCDLSVDLMIK